VCNVTAAEFDRECECVKAVFFTLTFAADLASFDNVIDNSTDSTDNSTAPLTLRGVIRREIARELLVPVDQVRRPRNNQKSRKRTRTREDHKQEEDKRRTLEPEKKKRGSEWRDWSLLWFVVSIFQ
jgi:hypothetical protein